MGDVIKERIQMAAADAGSVLAAHPIATATAIIGGLLVLNGLGQIRSGETYMDEARAKRGTRKALVGLVLLLLMTWATGIIDYAGIIAFWLS